MKHRAESLIEILIAITVIVISTGAALTLVRTSLQGNEVIGDKIVAMNLAMEGIEAVRNIRDSNYLRLSSDPDACWNTLGVDDVTNCSTGESITDGVTYYLQRDFTDRYLEWTLVEATDEDTDGSLDLYEYDNGTVVVPLYALSGIPLDGFTTMKENQYQRLLEVDYVDSEAFNLTATVHWTVDDEPYSISLTRTIAHVY